MSESSGAPDHEERAGRDPAVLPEEPPAEHTLAERYSYASPTPPAYVEPGLFMFRERAGLFGSNAPPYTTLFPGPSVPGDGRPPSWDLSADTGIWTAWSPYPTPTRSYRIAAGCDIVLERVVGGVTRGSWIVLELPDRIFRPFWVDSSFERVFTGFTIASRATGLRLRFANGDEGDEPASPSIRGSNPLTLAPLDIFNIRETTAHVVSERVHLAATPDPASIAGAGEIELETRADGLAPGQTIFLRGRGYRSDAVVSEFVTVGAVRHDALGRTWVTPVARLQNAYERASLVINANVVEATHGETVRDEVLGSGDAGLASQRFTLRRGPLSHSVASGDFGGLSVRVDGVEWRRVASPLDAGPNDETWTLRSDLDGRAVVTFGDGERGRRLPTGVENVVATYRAGAGAAGNVAAGAAASFRTQPRGVRSVTNPGRASGGSDGDLADELRRSAPRRTMLIDRVVSLRDHETWALSQAGVAKACAVALRSGERRVVHVTVADSNGDPLPDDAKRSLRVELSRVRDGQSGLAFGDCVKRGFRVAASVRVAEGRAWEGVRGAVTRALREAFSAQRRAITQRVSASEVVAVMQGVAGVLAVRLNAFYLAPSSAEPSGDGTAVRVNDVLLAPGAREAVSGRSVVLLPARLLAIDPDPAGVALTLSV